MTATEPKLKILFVDDEVPILNALRREFYGSGLDITFVSDDLAAFELVQTTTFALVVSDYLMPNKKGTEILAKVKECSPKTRRILLSGSISQRGKKVAGTEEVMHHYIEKPWQKEALFNLIQAELALYQESL